MNAALSLSSASKQLTQMVASPDRGLGPVLQSEFAQNSLHVHLNRRLGDDQLARDDLVRRPFVRKITSSRRDRLLSTSPPGIDCTSRSAPQLRRSCPIVRLVLAEFCSAKAKITDLFERPAETRRELPLTLPHRPP